MINVTDPYHLRVVGHRDTPGIATGITCDDDFCYIADYVNGLRIYRVNRPEAPVLFGYVPTPGYACAVAVQGDFAYVADWNNLQIVDVSNHGDPQPRGSLGMPDEAWGVDVAGQRAFVATLSGGVRIVDVSDPSAPRETGFVITPGLARGVTVVEWR